MEHIKRHIRECERRLDALDKDVKALQEDERLGLISEVKFHERQQALTEKVNKLIVDMDSIKRTQVEKVEEERTFSPTEFIAIVSATIAAIASIMEQINGH